MYRALIVEDEDLMRDYLADNLSVFCEEWRAADTASDGRNAIQKLTEDHFDGIITDICMPEMDGLEMAKWIRSRNPDIPILIISGYDEFDYARKAVRLNICDYLLKPIDEQEISAALSAMAIQVAQRAPIIMTEKAVPGSTHSEPGLAQQALSYLQHHYGEPISLTSLADELSISSAYLSTIFHREIGISYSRMLLKIRMDEAAKLLLNTSLQVQQIAQMVGFVSSKHFIHVFRKYYSLSPTEFRHAGDATFSLF